MLFNCFHISQLKPGTQNGYDSSLSQRMSLPVCFEWEWINDKQLCRYLMGLVFLSYGFVQKSNTFLHRRKNIYKTSPCQEPKWNPKSCGPWADEPHCCSRECLWREVLLSRQWQLGFHYETLPLASNPQTHVAEQRCLVTKKREFVLRCYWNLVHISPSSMPLANQLLWMSSR